MDIRRTGRSLARSSEATFVMAIAARLLLVNGRWYSA